MNTETVKTMNKTDVLDRYRGCLIGGAIGDALGFAVEFMTYEEICDAYGERGIQDYDLREGLALISDDTQMTLYTANGILAAYAKGRGYNREEYATYIWEAYLDWLETQNPGEFAESPVRCAWLNNLSELHSMRAPGTTCINALAHGIPGTMEKPCNYSKGCGGVMRVSPIGLFIKDRREAALLGAEEAAFTHGHELGYISAAMYSAMINALVYNEVTMWEAVELGKSEICEIFKGFEYLQEQIDLIDRAVELAKDNMEDVRAIGLLGEGWTGEETLAIGIYCALKHGDSLRDALVAAVNHSGDSDSTGAVAGGLVGAALGFRGMDKELINPLELKEAILAIADDLYRAAYEDPTRDRVWEEKYVSHTYRL